MEQSPSLAATNSQLEKKFSTSDGTRKFITVFTRSLHMCLSWARSIHSTPPIQCLHLILSYYLLLGRDRHFQDRNSQNYTKLYDDRRVMTSKFILGITTHLNKINMKIEGKWKLLCERSRKSYNTQHVSKYKTHYWQRL